MPQTYYDFDLWKRAADNIASGMVAVAKARNRKAMFDAEMQQRAPLVEAQTRNYNANAAKDEYDLSRAKINDTQDETDAAELEKEVQQNPDGTFTFTHRGVQIFSGALLRKAKGAADLTGGMENLEQGANYVQNEKAKRENQRQMNDADNAAAMERTKFMAGSRTAQGNVELIREARSRADEYSKAIAKFENENGTPDVSWSEDKKRAPMYSRWLDLRNGYEKALRDMKRFMKSSPDENNSLTPPPTQEQGVNTPAAAPAVNDKAAYADKLIQAFNATPISDPAKREAARKKLEDMLANLGYTLNSTNAPAK